MTTEAVFVSVASHLHSLQQPLCHLSFWKVLGKWAGPKGKFKRECFIASLSWKGPLTVIWSNSPEQRHLQMSLSLALLQAGIINALLLFFLVFPFEGKRKLGLSVVRNSLAAAYFLKILSSVGMHVKMKAEHSTNNFCGHLLTG